MTVRRARGNSRRAGGEARAPVAEAVSPRGERRRAVLLGLALLVCYSYFYYVGGNWNIASHYAQVLAIAEEHRLAIDSFHTTTGDEAFYNGHYYSDKLLGPALISAPVYMAVRPLVAASAPTPGMARLRGLAVTNVVSNAIPSAVLGALLYLFLAELGLSAGLRVWLTLAYGLGTLAFPYSTALFGHQLGAVCAAGAFMLLWRQKRGWRLWPALGAGALVGLGAICDFTTLLVAVFIGLYGLWVASGRASGRPVSAGQFAERASPFALVAFAFVMVQLTANWATFGAPLTFPHYYHVQAAFRARHQAGLLGVHLPKLMPLYQLTFGSWRGLFYASPVLLLALPGFFLLPRKWRGEAVLIAAAWLGVLLMSAGYENWTSGSSYGPRYQVAAIPLLMLAVAPAAPRWPFAFKALTGISVLFTFVVTAHTAFGIPEDRTNPLAFALGEFAAGRLLQQNVGMALGLPGLMSLLPLVVVAGGLVYAAGKTTAGTTD